LRGAVGLGGIVVDGAGIANDPGDLSGQFADGDVAACADVDQVGGVGTQADVEAGGGHVVHVQEFAPGCAGAPEQDAGRDRGMGRDAEGLLEVGGNRAEAGDILGDTAPVLDLGQLGEMEFADQRRQDVGGFQVEVVVRAVQVGGHDRDIGGPVLAVVGVAHLDPGDLGDGVGRIGGFQRAGEQGVLADRLGGEFGVDAGTAQEDQAFHPGPIRLMEDVDLDQQVFVNELAAIDIIGVNAANLGGGEKHDIRAFLGEEARGRRLIEQIEFGVGAQNQVGVALRPQGAHQGGTHQAAMASDVNPGVRFDRHCLSLSVSRVLFLVFPCLPWTVRRYSSG